MENYSPLRYPGGKGRVADFFKRIFRANDLCDGVYIEPYAGGASVGLSLLMNEYASTIVINDIDPAIYAFWHAVLKKTDQLCDLILSTPVSVGTWDQQKRIQIAGDASNLLRLGFSTFFLNRTNRSGILSGGIIGGRSQDGEWKIDARYNKETLVGRIRRIAEYKDRIDLHNSDAVRLLRRLRKKLPSNSLFYFDPPYYVQGKNLYLNYYSKSDHSTIAQEISCIASQKWVVTYDDVDPIRALYTSYRSEKFSLGYSAGSDRRSGQEIMVFSNQLSVPTGAIT